MKTQDAQRLQTQRCQPHSRFHGVYTWFLVIIPLRLALLDLLKPDGNRRVQTRYKLLASHLTESRWWGTYKLRGDLGGTALGWVGLGQARGGAWFTPRVYDTRDGHKNHCRFALRNSLSCAVSLGSCQHPARPIRAALGGKM